MVAKRGGKTAPYRAWRIQMKRLLPFIIVCISVVVFAAVGPMVGEQNEQAHMGYSVSPVSVEPLN
jgi:hypothetical protein